MNRQATRHETQRLQPLCAICVGVRLKPLGQSGQFRCPGCSRLYDFSDEGPATHNNPAIAAEINERALPRQHVSSRRFS